MNLSLEQLNLFCKHRDLPEKLARRWNRSDIDAEALAFDTFYECLQRFDPSRGTPFRGYASTCISRNLRREALRAEHRRELLADAPRRSDAEPCLLINLVLNDVPAHVALELQVSTAPIQAAA